MTYEELDKICKAYVHSDKKHKELLNKFFPMIWNKGLLPRPITVLTKKDIETLMSARLKVKKTRGEFYKAIIEYSKSRR